MTFIILKFKRDNKTRYVFLIETENIPDYLTNARGSNRIRRLFVIAAFEGFVRSHIIWLKIITKIITNSFFTACVVLEKRSRKNMSVQISISTFYHRLYGAEEVVRRLMTLRYNVFFETFKNKKTTSVVFSDIRVLRFYVLISLEKDHVYITVQLYNT